MEGGIPVSSGNRRALWSWFEIEVSKMHTPPLAWFVICWTILGVGVIGLAITLFRPIRIQKITDIHNLRMVLAAFILAGAVGFLPPSQAALSSSEPGFRTVDLPIVAAQDAVSVSGSWFLGCGSVEGTMYYFFYTQDHIGRLVLHKVQADGSNVTILEHDADIAFVRYSYFHSYSRQENWTPLNDNPNTIRVCEFHVPRGSVTRTIQFDLE